MNSDVLEISSIIDGMIDVRKLQTFDSGIVVSYRGREAFVPLTEDQIAPIVGLLRADDQTSPPREEEDEISFEPSPDEDDDEDMGISSV